MPGTSMSSSRSQRVWLVSLAALLSSAAACSPATGGFRRTLPVSGPVDLEVLTSSGDIVARTGPPGQVSIAARVQASGALFGGSEEDVRAVEQSPPISQSGSSIKLDHPPMDNVSIDYEITVPPDTRLRADTGSGDLRVRGPRRGIDVHTGSGDVDLDDIAGGVRAETGSGDVRADRVAAPADVDTGSGDVRLTLTSAGVVRAHTGSGDVEIRGASGSLTVGTGSGRVVAEGMPSAGWSLETSSGDVTLRLGRQSSYDLDVGTGSGDITVARPVQMTVQGRVSDSGRDQLAGRVGSGGPLVKVRTGSGDVDID